MVIKANREVGETAVFEFVEISQVNFVKRKTFAEHSN